MSPILILLAGLVSFPDLGEASDIAFLPGDACYCCGFLVGQEPRPDREFVLGTALPMVAPGPAGMLASRQRIGCTSLTIKKCSPGFCENFLTAVRQIRVIHPRWVSFPANAVTPVRREVTERDLTEQDSIELFVVARDIDVTHQCPFYRYNEAWRKELSSILGHEPTGIRQYLPDPTSENEIRSTEFPPLPVRLKKRSSAPRPRIIEFGADVDWELTGELESTAEIAILMIHSDDFETLWRDAAGCARPETEGLEPAVDAYMVTDKAVRKCRFNGKLASEVVPLDPATDLMP